jgi:hypothetical protein
MGRQASPLLVAETGPFEEVAGAGGGETLVVAGVVAVCVGVVAGAEGVVAGVEGVVAGAEGVVARAEGVVAGAVVAAITGVGAVVARPLAVSDEALLEEPQPLSTKHAS